MLRFILFIVTAVTAYSISNSYTFTIQDIPRLPRVGEQVNIPFFQEYMGTSSFYVNSIHHSFSDSEQFVFFELLGGYYNLFWHWRKDKAELRNEIDWRDFFRLDDWQLKKKINLPITPFNPPE